MSEERTRRFLAAMAEHDFATLADLFDPDVTVVNLMTLDGSQDSQRPHRGRDQAAAYFRQVDELMPQRELRDLRVTTAGDTVFVQFNGDFRTADGRPYRNVYVFRFDWRDGRITSLEEYGNPITFINTFPELVHSESPGSPMPSSATRRSNPRFPA
jgi:ketosteroid isomerase-like protein